MTAEGGRLRAGGRAGGARPGSGVGGWGGERQRQEEREDRATHTHILGPGYIRVECLRAPVRGAVCVVAPHLNPPAAAAVHRLCVEPRQWRNPSRLAARRRAGAPSLRGMLTAACRVHPRLAHVSRQGERRRGVPSWHRRPILEKAPGPPQLRR